jgi:hypothetical protein
MKRVFYSGILTAAAFAATVDTARAQSNVYSLNAGSFLFQVPVKTHSLFIGPQSNQFGLQTELQYPAISLGSTPRPHARFTSFTLDFVHASVDPDNTRTTRLATFSPAPFRLSLNPWLATPILLIVSARLWIVFFRDRRQKFQPAIPLAN